VEAVFATEGGAAGASTLVEPPRGAAPGYEVLGELGRGGMGVVYRARQVSLNRQVALKVIRAGAQADPEALARFQKEAEAVAKLNHPHVVQVYELGRWQPPGAPEPLPYLALELVPGGSLAGRLRQGLPDPREAARLVELLARAVQAAHQAGLVHRDLKPANVLLAAPAEGCPGGTSLGVPKVSDFGTARFLGGGAGLTASGVVLGTPSYIAPEQAAGSKEVGPAADVYGLGAILYECLTGQVPFRSESWFDTLRQVVQQPPTPPRQLRAEVPADLEAVCLRCLAKAPGDRYPSAQALAEDLASFLAGQALAPPPAGPPVPGSPRRPPWWRRARWVAAAALALAVAGGLGAWLLRGRHAAPEAPAGPLRIRPWR
jgi:serine/threonine protein kinase